MCCMRVFVQCASAPGTRSCRVTLCMDAKVTTYADAGEGGCMQHSEPSKMPRTLAEEMQQLWRWACMVVSSRSFCLLDNEGNKYACLSPLAGTHTCWALTSGGYCVHVLLPAVLSCLPLICMFRSGVQVHCWPPKQVLANFMVVELHADFANHDAISSNTTFEVGVAPCSCSSAPPDSGCPALVLRARASMARGDEVTINYGADKSNVLLLDAYGFTTPANLADRLPWGWRRWGVFADVLTDLNNLDGTCARVLESLGVQLDTLCTGMFTISPIHACCLKLHCCAAQVGPVFAS